MLTTGHCFAGLSRSGFSLAEAVSGASDARTISSAINFFIVLGLS